MRAGIPVTVQHSFGLHFLGAFVPRRQCMIHGLSPLFLLFLCCSPRLFQYLYRHELARIHVDGFVYFSKLPRSEHISYCHVSHLWLLGSRRVESEPTPAYGKPLAFGFRVCSDHGVVLCTKQLLTTWSENLRMYP